MKGIASYIVTVFVMSFLTILTFHFLGQLLSSEVEVSTVSGKISSLINEVEYSKFYFHKYLENRYLELKNKGVSDEDITKEIKSEAISLSLDNSRSIFKPLDVSQNDGTITVKGVISNKYTVAEMEMDSTYDVVFIFG